MILTTAGIIIALPIIIPLVLLLPDLVSKIEYSKKNSEIDKTIRELNKLIDKLEKKKQKEKDPNKIKEIDKAINIAKEQIKKLEEQKTAKKESREMEYGLKLIQDKIVGKFPYDSDIDQLSLWLNYYCESNSQIDKILSESKYDGSKDVEKYFLDQYDDENTIQKENIKYFEDNKLTGTKWVDFLLIDDTYLLYCCKNKKIYYGDPYESIVHAKVYTPMELKSKLKELVGGKSYNSLVKADAYLGYYRLSKAPSNVTPKPVPEIKQ